MFPNILTSILYKNTINQLNNIIQKSNYRNKLEDSIIFDNKEKKNKIDLSVRKSKKVTFANPKIINIVENKLNTIFKHKKIVFEIIDKQDLLQYKQGDYFKFHKDFRDNFIDGTEIYTVLIGLKNCISGGQTIIKINNKNKYFKQTTRKGGLLVFKSNLFHSGTIINKGTKEILVLTVRVRQKYNIYKKTNNLDTFISTFKLLSYIFKTLPTNIVNNINLYMDKSNIFIENQISYKLSNIIKNTNLIPIQLSIHSQINLEQRNSNLEIFQIRVYLFNGLHYRNYYINSAKYVRHSQNLLSLINDNFEKDIETNHKGIYNNLYTSNDLKSFDDLSSSFYINYDLFPIYNKHYNLPIDISTIIHKFIQSLNYDKMINPEFKKEIEELVTEQVMCNGIDGGYEMDEYYSYIQTTISFYYGFLIT